jgi:ABC-type dipeptide/oligopeptide/nickel transport system permease subunit
VRSPSRRRFRAAAPGRASLVAGLLIAGAATLVCLVSLVWTPCDPAAMNPSERFAAPSWEHPFGTDQFGRDILSRTMAAAQPAFAVGVGSVLLGSVAGAAVMRCIDGLMAFPGILLAMVLVLALGRGLTSVLVAIAVFMVPTFARLTCQTTLELRGALFVRAARSCGCGPVAVAVRHIVPNIAPRLVTQLTASVGTAMLLEASLSFLGLGVQPPAASWGYMLSEALPYIFGHPGLAVAPGVGLMVVVLGFNLLGDALNDRLVRRGAP